MKESIDISHILKALKDMFAETAAECSAAFFGQETGVSVPWTSEECLRDAYDHTLYVLGENPRFRCIARIGVQNEYIRTFVREAEEDPEMVADALGEFANVYFGMVTNMPEFREHFGGLKASPPSYMRRNEAVFPYMKGIGGIVFNGNPWISVCVAVADREQQAQ